MGSGFPVQKGHARERDATAHTTRADLTREGISSGFSIASGFAASFSAMRAICPACQTAVLGAFVFIQQVRSRSMLMAGGDPAASRDDENRWTEISDGGT